MTERAKALRKCWGSLPEKRQKLAKKKPFIKTIQKIAVDFQGVYTLYIYIIEMYTCMHVYIYMHVRQSSTNFNCRRWFPFSPSSFRRRFSVGFKKTMAFQPRVIKQNRGSSDPELLTFAALNLVKPAFFWGVFWIYHPQGGAP